DTGKEEPVEFTCLPADKLGYSLYAASNGITNACTMLIPKTKIDETGRFDETLHVAQDDEYTFRLAKVSSFRYIPQCKVYKRIHPEQDSNKLEKYIPLCSRVWIKNIASVTADEATKMYGSPYAYYSHMKRLMAAAQYLDAKTYALELAQLSAPEETDPFLLAVRQAGDYQELHAALHQCKNGYHKWLCRRYLTKPELKEFRFRSFAKRMLLRYLPILLLRRWDKDAELKAALQAPSQILRLENKATVFADDESRALLFALARSTVSQNNDYAMVYERLHYQMYFEPELFSTEASERLVCIALDRQLTPGFTARFGKPANTMAIVNAETCDQAQSLRGFDTVYSYTDRCALEQLAAFASSFICITEAKTARSVLERILPTLSEIRPQFAINVSCVLDEMLDCIELLQGFDSRYRFFLRHYSGTLQNTVLYAVFAA
ncbi:MAG: hypothetical protein PHC80_09530, partial [Eubacteriales bacterium]|nr:hypothetical protein [Eubacteriales bacterium]